MADRRGRSVIVKFPCIATLSEVRSSLQKENEGAKITVVQDLGGGEFLIEFENKTHAEEFIDRGIDFNDIHLSWNPPHGYYVNVSILGLRAYIDDDKVIEALSEYGEIKSKVIRLKYKIDHDLAGLEKGNRLVRMVLGRTSIPYSNIDGRWCHIIHNNQQRVCTICHAISHSRRKCPEIECRRCNNKGHIASHCPEPEPTPDITAINETVTHSPPENTPEDISDPPVNEPPQKEPEPDPQLPPLDNNIEQPSPENNPTEEHMDDEDAQRGSSKRPHQTDSDSDPSALPRRSKIKPTPNLKTARRPK